MIVREYGDQGYPQLDRAGAVQWPQAGSVWLVTEFVIQLMMAT